MRKPLIILVAFIFFNQISFSHSSKFDSLVIAGIKQIYSIKFNEAENTFRKLIQNYPNHPAGKFFMAMTDWWRILLDPSTESRDELFYEKIEEVIDHCEDILEENPENVDAIFFKGGAIGFRGRLRSLRSDWLSAADDGREALPLVEYAGELDPDNIDVQFGFGIYNYYAAVIPERYPIVKPLMIFLPSGDKELGLKQLKNVAENGKYTTYESQYFLMSLYYRFEQDYSQAEKYALKLTTDFPDNPVFERWRGRIAVKKGELELADSVFRDILIKSGKKLPGYNTFASKREASYYVGYHLRSLALYDSAEVYFNKCVEYSLKLDEDEESGFLVNSTLYIGMIKESKKEFNAAKMYYDKVLDMREYKKSHTLAERYLERIAKFLED